MEEKNKKNVMLKGQINKTKTTKTPIKKTKLPKSPIKTTKSRSRSKSPKKGRKKFKKKKKKKKSKSEEKDKNTVVDNTVKKTENKIVNDKPLIIKKEEKKKIFVDKKIGTPHFDAIKYIKTEIDSKVKKINELSILKIKYVNKLKIMHDELKKILSTFNESPEEKNKIALLYVILNVNKKNNNDSMIKKKSLKEEYKELLNKINYNSIEKINEYKAKIDISKSDNLYMKNRIKELKNKHIKKNNLLKFEFDTKYNNDLYNLMKELNVLNITKHEALDRINNNKKLINNYVVKFRNLLDSYEDYKNENINIDNNSLNKIDKNINILKNDLSGNGQELYNKILNNQIILFKDIYLTNKTKNHSQIYNRNLKYNSNKIQIKKLKKVTSVESLLANNRYDEFNNNNQDSNYKCSSIRKKLLNLKELPMINTKFNFKINYDDIKKFNYNSNIVKNNNSAKIIFNDVARKQYFDDSNISINDDMNLEELYNKKRHYMTISKKLDNSIKEVENMYKRKISQAQEMLNENINKINNLEKNNNELRCEIKSLYEFFNSQKNL